LTGRKFGNSEFGNKVLRCRYRYKYSSHAPSKLTLLELVPMAEDLGHVLIINN
jgi:hypothetical protein